MAIKIKVQFKESNQSFTVQFKESNQSFIVGFTEKIQIGGGLPSYPGPYAVTPGPNAQVLATNGKAMTGDVTIAAIPQNYGLITYNGYSLTVS